jgi:serine/threonine protein kinase/tetratricopeptide (TPR) repeat protein
MINPQWLDAEDFIDAFETAQARDGEAEVAQFLPEPDHPLYREVLCELVRVDLEYRWRHGQPRPLESYQHDHPDLFQDLESLGEVAFEEYRLRQQAGQNPSPAEYQQRFGVPCHDWPGQSGTEDDAAKESAGPAVPHESAGLEEIALAYQDFRWRNVETGAEDSEAWSASFPGSAHARVFRDLHRSNPRAALHLAQAVTSLPKMGEKFLDFQLMAELGKGAFGKVFLARQGGLANRYVALKIAPEIGGESQTLAQLQHTHIVPIYSVHQAGPLQAVCMPYFGSTTLGDVVRHLHGREFLPDSGKGLVSTLHDRQSKTFCREGVMPAGLTPHSKPSQTQNEQLAEGRASPQARETTLKKLEQLSYVQAILWLASQLADGLAHAHDRGILHRDLKPTNILLTDEGEPMLLDFNLSEDTKLRSGASAALVGGTLPYMAPEHLDAFQGGRRPVDACSDLYAFGVIFYELLTGRHPFTVHRGPLEDVLPLMMADRLRPPPSLRRLNQAVSPAVESIVRRCLEPDPGKRYQTAHELREDLQRQLDHLPLKFAPEPSRMERVRKWTCRHPRLVSSTSVAAVAALIVALFGILLLARTWQLAREKAYNSLNLLREEMKTIQFLLNSPNPERDQLEEGIALCRQTLDRYGVLEGVSWQNTSLVRSLPPEEQRALGADLGELLLSWARVLPAQVDSDADPAGRNDRIQLALHLNALAETCYAPDEVPRALWLQRARLTRLDGQDAEARRLEEEAEKVPLRTARERYLLLNDQIERGQFREALSLLRALSGRDRQNALSWLLLGNFHKALSQQPDAAACYDVAIALGPDSHWAYYQRGVLRLEQRNYRQACADFDEALRLKPNHVNALINRALAKYGLEDYQGAITDLNQAVEQGTPSTRVYFMRARMRAKAGDLKGAKRDQEEGLRRRPSDENDWIARGEARVPHDPQGALADFEKALELNPHSRAALQDKASVLSENLGRAKDSVPVFDRLVTLYPDYVLARSGRGVILARLKQREAALQDAKESLARDSKPETLYQVAGIYALTSRQNPDDRREAFRLLSSTLQKGYGFALLDKDSDLDPIRDQPEFRRLVEAARALRAGDRPAAR